MMRLPAIKIRMFTCLVVLAGLQLRVPVWAQNAPVSTIGTTDTYGTLATIAVTAADFSNIGSFSLKILYDPQIAQAVAVNIGPMLGGNLSVNLNNPGMVFVSWFTSNTLTLPGTPVVLNINFSKIITGTSLLTWLDDGISCSWYNESGVVLNDQPTANYYLNGAVTFLSPDAPNTLLPIVSACANSIASVPVRVTNFNNIGRISLQLSYDPTAAGYQGYTNTSGFPGLTADGSQPGLVVISGIVPAGNGIVLADSAELLRLTFMATSGATDLIWIDNGATCQYAGPPPAYFILNDTPQNSYYLNGSVSALPLPASAGIITGPPGGDVCAGQSGVNFSITPVQHANSYFWSLPPEAVITAGASTNNITVSFGNNPENWNVTAYGINSCGNGPLSPVFPLAISEAPYIISQPVTPAVVNAGAGIATFQAVAAGAALVYQWQELVTTWIDIADSGIYSGSSFSELTLINPTAAMNGRHYRCRISGLCPPEVFTDGEAQLVVSNLTGISDEMRPYGKTPTLQINPNPVEKASTVKFNIPENGIVSIEIRNICGERVRVIRDGIEVKGTHEIQFSPDFMPGLYIAVLRFRSTEGAGIATEKFIMK
jgi:hypothetical protein